MRREQLMTMKIQSGEIILQNLRFHAFHGVMPQERFVGNDYVLNLRISYPLAAAATSDKVADTLNYADVYAFVAEEMNQPSALVEHVAQRIAQRLKHAFPRITSISLQLLKYNLPMGGDADGAGVAFTFIFEE